MSNNGSVTNQTIVADLTLGQLKDAMRDDNAATKDYIHGVKGIAKLFGVCQTMAQRYKDTFLKPAVIQNGKTIIIKTETAIRLFQEEGLKK